MIIYYCINGSKPRKTEMECVPEMGSYLTIRERTYEVTEIHRQNTGVQIELTDV